MWRFTFQSSHQQKQISHAQFTENPITIVIRSPQFTSPCDRTRPVKSLWNYLSRFSSQQKKISSEFLRHRLEIFAKRREKYLEVVGGKIFYEFIVADLLFSRGLGQRIHSHYNLTLHNNKQQKML